MGATLDPLIAIGGLILVIAVVAAVLVIGLVVRGRGATPHRGGDVGEHTAGSIAPVD